jgi:hypothetical protein
MATIGLISCVSKKQKRPIEAKHLYVSPLFLKSRQFVQQQCDNWFVLSAKYGLVKPDQVIQPYEETLNSKSRSEREEWAHAVWHQLKPLLNHGDRVMILAGSRYREFLVPLIESFGCHVVIPMEGKSIGKQLQWLSNHSYQPGRSGHLNELYSCLRSLETGLGGKRCMANCTGRLNWPNRGVYFFFEPEEVRCETNFPRVVRVGTHAVSSGSKTTLWNRLHTHRGNADGLGNHRGSIFRLHVGAALVARDSRLWVPSWGIGQSATRETRESEAILERAVSNHIGAMTVLWLDVGDESGPASDRAYLERNLLGLLNGPSGPADPPSPSWLGRFSPNSRIQDSGLWNLDFLDYHYKPEVLAILAEYVAITLGRTPVPDRPLSPPDWHYSDRQRISRNQLPLFGD